MVEGAVDVAGWCGVLRATECGVFAVSATDR